MSQPIRICLNEEMRKLDLQAEEEFGIEARILMENAGRAAAQVLLEHYPDAGIETEILVFAGKGNNAGDAFAIARRLLNLERRVRVFYLAEPKQYRGAVLKNFEILQKLKAKMTFVESLAEVEAFFRSSPGPFTAVDGILGTGLKGNLDGLYYDVVEHINEQQIEQVVSLDIPSGVHGDTGEVSGTSILASLTISFGFPKLGHFLPPGAARRGELVNVDISLPAKFGREGKQYLLRSGPLVQLLEARDRYGHKNSFGHTLLIGGSPGRLGAIAMAARACHKMGTGLVTVATWEDALDALLVKLPDETMAVPMKLEGPELEAYRAALPSYSSVVVGPGLGMRPEGKLMLEHLLGQYRGAVVLDADALNLVAEHRLYDLLLKRRAPTVLTPHPGEMSRLLRISKDEVVRNPLKAVRAAAEMTGSVVVLKGAATLIAAGEQPLYLSHYPNDGMATAGMGDVLAGMVGGLVGQKMDPFQATLLGVYLHSLAGDFAAKAKGHRSMTAPDIIENIGNAFKDLKASPTARTREIGRARLL